jgi:hypothetical protein
MRMVLGDVESKIDAAPLLLAAEWLSPPRGSQTLVQLFDLGNCRPENITTINPLSGQSVRNRLSIKLQHERRVTEGTMANCDGRIIA